MDWHNVVFKGLKMRRKQTLLILSGTILGVLMITTVLASYQGMRESIKKDMVKYGETYMLTHKNRSEQISYRGVPLLIDTGEQTKKLTFEMYTTLRDDSKNHFIGISPRAIKSVTNKDDDKKFALVAIDFFEEKKMKPWWKVWGNFPKNTNEVLLGYDVAQKYSLYQGDHITLNSEQHQQTFKISGYLHYTGHIDDKLIYTFIDHPFFADGIDFVEAVLPYKKRIHNNNVPKGWTWSKLESTIDEKAQVIDNITKITPYLFSVTILLGAAIIFVSLISQIEERRKEFSLWRAIGFNRSLIIRLLITEVLTLAIIGSLIGFIAGLISANVLNAVMSEFSFFAFVSIKQALIIFISAILVSFLTAIVPISLALKQDPLKLLKTGS